MYTLEDIMWEDMTTRERMQYLLHVRHQINDLSVSIEAIGLTPPTALLTMLNAVDLRIKQVAADIQADIP
jgi:hypothetical protein